MSDEPAPALKELFNEARYRNIARSVAAVYPAFDSKAFLRFTLTDLDSRNLMQRVRRVSDGLNATLPADFKRAVAILRDVAPTLERGFTTLFLPDFVGTYGQKDFTTSLEALKFFTPFGSSEFAIREFLRLDLIRTLKAMEKWSRDSNEHVRRLSSEGCRPRLPWSFRLDALITDPSAVAPILENLKTDSSLYVRKSVANHLNDITKDHPDWVLERIANWPQENPATQWIIKHALRTLIKRGDRAALAVIGAGEPAKVKVNHFTIEPKRIRLGESVGMSFHLDSASKKSQKLVIDYAVHYVKKSGGTSAKVFKWKLLTLEPGQSLTLSRRQSIRNFTTREHYAGKHAVDLLINGEKLASAAFELMV